MPSSNNTREDSTHGHHQMVNTKIRLIILFEAKDGETLYSQQKQDQELTVAQIMNSLLPNSDWNWMVLWRPTRPSRTNTQKDILFIIGDWNANVGSQKTPGVKGNFGLGRQTEAGQRLIEFCQENTLVKANTLFQQHKRRFYTWTSPDGQHRNLIIFFAAKDGEALYSQQKQDQELTVAQIMNSLLPNSHLNWRK